MKRRNARRKPIPPDLEGMVAQYIETALWSSTDEVGTGDNTLYIYRVN